MSIMPQRRQERIGEQLHQELMDVLQRRIRDPRLTSITVTAVEVTPDLKQATVFVTSLGDREARREALQNLQRASSFIRRELSQSLNMRFTPDLHFVLDESWQRGARIDQLLDQIHENEPRGMPDEPNETPHSTS
jgi:ribosome-binding factor A